MSYKINPNYDLDKIYLNETDLVKSVMQNIKCLLKTRKGTCPMYRDFGLEMKWLDKPVNIARQLMWTDIREGIVKWEPRCELVDITFAIDSDRPERLIPTVEVEIVGE